MHFVTVHKWLTTFSIVLLSIIAITIWQIIFIRVHHGAPVLPPTIPRDTEYFGSIGSKIRYVVIGDSTSIAQGAPYAQGIARGTALSLARTHVVDLTNLGISGATTADVLNQQVAKAVTLKPDLVLIAVGANDVTHLTSLGTVKKDMANIISQLQVANPNVQIVLTGSPAMGSVERFAPPTKWIAGIRTRQINNTIAGVAASKHVIFVELAQKTGRAFLHNPSLFAADNFHPNAAGYAVWLPVIENSISQTRLP